MDTNKIEDIQTFLDVSIQSSCEGLMVKLYENDEASYEPSKRSRNWLKVKKDYLAGVGDTVDLVVIGAFKGKGKRTNVYGSFLLACYDPETEEYQTVCKLGTGFSDENLQKFYTDLNEHKIQQPKRFYCIGENPETPDVWFAPHIVWEIQCADLSISPRYMAGVGVVSVSMQQGLQINANYNDIFRLILPKASHCAFPGLFVQEKIRIQKISPPVIRFVLSAAHGPCT